MIAFLDACVIIYWVEMKNPYYGQFANKIHELREHYGTLSFAASQLSLLECNVKPTREKNEDILNRYKKFFNARDLLLIPVSLEVIEQATWLRANYNLPTPDALQASSALSIAEETLFLTGDKIFKKVPRLEVNLI